MGPDLTGSANRDVADSSAPGASQSDKAYIAVPIPLRKLPKGEYYFQDNEVMDIYAPIVGPFAVMIYSALCRKSYGNPTVEYAVRDLALSGMSPTTAARAIQILETVGMIKRLLTSGNRKSLCQLVDLKALAFSHGATRERKSAPLELPKLKVDQLKTQVEAIRQSQQGKARARAILTGKRNVEVAAKTGFNSLFAVSQRDASVSHLIRQRATRETQRGTYLIQKEGRIEEIPSPTPSRSGEAQKDKNSPDEDELDWPLKLARAKFIGAINEWEDGLFDTSGSPAPHLVNGAADAKKYGFKSLAVEDARQRGETLVLILSADDPAAARRGLEKYCVSFSKCLRKWFGCEAHWEIQKTTRN